jgi:erythromycin esterase
MIRFCFVHTLLALLLVACSSPSESIDTEAEAANDTLSCFEAACFPLNGFDPNIEDDSDLEILKELIGDADVVALGECTHGSSEIIMMRHRITKYLVENMGFTVIAFEAGFADVHDFKSDNVEDYIVKMDYWIYSNREMREFFQWMIGKNGEGNELHISGFDIQSIEGALQALHEFSINHDDQKLGVLIDDMKILVDKYLEDLKRHRKDKSKETKDRRYAIAVEMKTKVDQIKTQLRTCFDSIDHLDVKLKLLIQQFAETLAQFSNYSIYFNTRLASKGSRAAVRYRDSCMASNLLWLRNHYGEKIIIWAHNEHVKFQENMMGMYLRTALQDSLFVLGTGTYSGYFTSIAKRIDSFPSTSKMLDAPATSFEAIAHNSGLSNLIFIPKRLPTQCPQREPNFAPIPMRSIGSVGYSAQFNTVNLMNAYDVILFIDSTNASHYKQ